MRTTHEKIRKSTWFSVEHCLPAEHAWVMVRVEYLTPDRPVKEITECMDTGNLRTVYVSGSLGDFWEKEGDKKRDWMLHALPWNSQDRNYEPCLSDEMPWQMIEWKDLRFRVTHWCYTFEEIEGTDDFY